LKLKTFTLPTPLSAGLIQNEEEDVINLVRNLVVNHIGGEYSENNIILITVPMSGTSFVPMNEFKERTSLF